MNYFKKNTRSSFLRLIQKAFVLNLKSHQEGSPSLNELIQISKEGEIDSRRKFIGTLAKAGLSLATLNALNACKKSGDLLVEAESLYRNRNTSLQPSIAIIGAGMAGLNCAYQLKKSGINATIYEGSARYSGRIRTQSDFIGQGIYTELGGEFIDSGHRNMLKLAREFSLPLMDTMSAAEMTFARDVFIIDGISYTEDQIINAFAPYANRIHADVSSLPNSFGFNNFNSTVFRLDQLSISGYFDSIGMPAGSFLRKGLEVAYNTEYGREVDDQTAINFLYLFSINPGNNNYQIFGASDERYKIQGGNQKLTDAIYQNIQTQVQFNQVLVRITQSNSGKYNLFFSNGSTSTADILVITMPFSLLRQVDLSTLSFPAWKTNAIQHLGYGTNAKLLLGFNQRVWRNYQQSGYVFTNGSPQSSGTFIQTGWDNSQLQPGFNGGYTVYQGGLQGNNLSVNDTIAFLDQMEQIWPGSRAAFNGNSKLIHWPSYPYSLGSYACWRVGQCTTILGAEILPIGNIYFAGEHTSAFNQGYMEGAAETGAKAAAQIAKKLQTGN